MSGWREATIADIAAPSRNALVGGPFGSNLVSLDYTPSGVPVIRGQNMGFGRWVSGEFVFVSEDKAEDLSRLVWVPPMSGPGSIQSSFGTTGHLNVEFLVRDRCLKKPRPRSEQP